MRPEEAGDARDAFWQPSQVGSFRRQPEGFTRKNGGVNQAEQNDGDVPTFSQNVDDVDVDIIYTYTYVYIYTEVYIYIYTHQY